MCSSDLQLRQGLIQAAVRAEVAQALTKVKVVHYNPDGTVQTPQQAAGPHVPGGSTALPAPAAAGPGTTPSGTGGE